MKAITLIESAAEYAGIKGFGSTLDGETLERGRVRLNSIIDEWQADNLYIPYFVEVVQTVTGSPVTIGTGQTINVTRPTFIRDTSFIRSNGVDYPLNWMQQREYNLIVNKSITSTRPVYAYYDGAFPVGRIYFYPAPISSEVHLQIDATLPQFVDFTTDYAIDTGYTSALELILAERLCIGIKDTPPDVARAGARARAIIRRNNAQIGVLQLPNILRNRRGYYGWY